jgi:cephalosporin hydroxylase
MNSPHTGDFYRGIPVNFDMSYLDYYRLRLLNQIQYHDLYQGVRILKFPEDLRTYERLIDDTKPEVIVELGIESGGSSIWFADRLQTLCGSGEVIGVDINTNDARQNIPSHLNVTIIDGDLTNPDIIKAVHDAVGGRRAMVIEDAAHDYACTSSALKNYWDLVPVGGWFIVEDGIVDIEPLRQFSWYPRGVLPAVEEFMETDEGKKFARHWLAPYGITSHPGGWLQREHQ